MKLIRIAILFIVYLAAASSFGQSANEVPPTADYDVLVYKTKSGELVYGIVCDNGTVHCGYGWDFLCKGGVAKNSDPFGNVIEGPGYSRDKKQRPMRMFVCK